MTIQMLTYQEQLELYPQLKEYLLKVPKLPDIPRLTPPWRVYGQQHNGGRWGRKDFPTYKGAFQYWKQRRNNFHDISITCKPMGFLPPGKIVKLRRNGEPLMVKTANGKRQATKLIPIRPPADHLWCLYCRRFVIFTWFTAHHAFSGNMKLLMDPTVRRCSICGVREETGAYGR